MKLPLLIVCFAVLLAASIMERKLGSVSLIGLQGGEGGAIEVVSQQRGRRTPWTRSARMVNGIVSSMPIGDVPVLRTKHEVALEKNQRDAAPIMGTVGKESSRSLLRPSETHARTAPVESKRPAIVRGGGVVGRVNRVGSVTAQALTVAATSRVALAIPAVSASISVASPTSLGEPVVAAAVIESAATEVMVLCKDPNPQPLATTWTMFNVSPKVGQADCHLLEFPGGKKVLIDAGEGYDAPGLAVGCLQNAGVTHLDLVVISHVHWDHYGRLIDIINSGITVDRVALSMPASRAIADLEIPWGCNWDDVQSMLQFLRDHNIPYWIPASGEKLVEVAQNGVTSALEVVCLFDGINTPVGQTDVNDTSMIVRLRHGRIRVLFTGDLNYSLGTWLATSQYDLSADLLKVPHHGTDGLAPNEFFDRVAPKMAFVTSPRDLWFSLRSKRAREYFSTHNIPTYVNGIDGTVTVWIGEDSYEVTTSGVK